MKRQEICAKTGLTPKALRLYEEKGLITPMYQSEGHNKMRDYSQGDLERLIVIATLRRAMFTITEIKEMLDDPRQIQVIFPQYLSWLREQSKQVSQLLAASEQVVLDEIPDALELSRRISSAAEKLPIPPADIHFRFRQLDALEDDRPSFSLTQKMDRALPTEKSFRQSVVAVSRDKMDNTLALNDQLNDTWDIFRPEDAGVAMQREIALTKGQKCLRLVLTLFILVGLVLILWAEWFSPMALLLPGVPLLLRLLLVWKDHNQEKRGWLKGLGWSNADFEEYRKRGIRIGLIAGLGVLVLGVGVAVMVELARPVETLDGPSTEEINIREFFDEFPPTLLGFAAFGSGFPDSYIVAEHKIYFQYGNLYSVDADYGNLMVIDKHVFHESGARSYQMDAYEDPCAMFIYEDFIYYLAKSKAAGRTVYLMRQHCGDKIKPQRILEGTLDQFEALGLSKDDEILIYTRDHGKWTVTEKVEIPQ